MCIHMYIHTYTYQSILHMPVIQQTWRPRQSQHLQCISSKAAELEVTTDHFTISLASASIFSVVTEPRNNMSWICLCKSSGRRECGYLGPCAECCRHSRHGGVGKWEMECGIWKLGFQKGVLSQIPTFWNLQLQCQNADAMALGDIMIDHERT